MTKAISNSCIRHWYLAENKDYDVFASNYKLNGELKAQGEKLQTMKDWCDQVNIEFTPTFFINGYQLPEQYKLEDVKYLFEK
jgi:protein-disulfide isomerase